MSFKDLCKDTALCDYLTTLLAQQDFVLTEEVIKTLHRLLYGETMPEVAGRYREESEELLHYLNHYLGQLEVSQRFSQPIEFATIAHKRFMDVAPFAQGNETIAELLLHLWLRRAGYITIPLEATDMEVYKAALQEARNPDCPDPETLIQFIMQNVVQG